MTAAKKPWTWCRGGCETKLTFAKRAGTEKTLPFEWVDRPPFSEPGLHVLIESVAFTPAEAIEHFQTRGEGRSEAAARELVSGYPFHRLHHCDEKPSSAEASEEPA